MLKFSCAKTNPRESSSRGGTHISGYVTPFAISRERVHACRPRAYGRLSEPRNGGFESSDVDRRRFTTDRYCDGNSYGEVIGRLFSPRYTPRYVYVRGCVSRRCRTLRVIQFESSGARWGSKHADNSAALTTIAVDLQDRHCSARTLCNSRRASAAPRLLILPPLSLSLISFCLFCFLLAFPQHFFRISPLLPRVLT